MKRFWIVLTTVAVLGLAAGCGSSGPQRDINDATNNTPRYLRNRVRAQLLPVIESLWPQAVPALCRLARLAGETQEVIAAKSSRLLPPDPRPGARRIAACTRALEASGSSGWPKHSG